MDQIAEQVRPVPPDTFKFLGMQLNTDLIMKLLALVFALGILYNKMDGLEDKLTARINAQSTVIEAKMETVNWRLLQVEKKIDNTEVQLYQLQRKP